MILMIIVGDTCNHVICPDCAKQLGRCPLCQREVLAVKKDEKMDKMIQTVIKYRGEVRTKTVC